MNQFNKVTSEVFIYQTDEEDFTECPECGSEDLEENIRENKIKCRVCGETWPLME